MGYDPVVNLYNQYNAATPSDLPSFDGSALNSSVGDFLNGLIGANNVVGYAPGGLTWEQYNNWAASQHTSIPVVPTAAFDTDLSAYGIKPVTGYTPTAEDNLLAEYNKFSIPTGDFATYTPTNYGGATGSTGWEQAYSNKIWGDKTYKGMNYYDYVRSIWGGLDPSTRSALTTQFSNEQAFQSQKNYDQYLSWLNEQGSNYNDALTQNASLVDAESANLPTPFMPNGAPKVEQPDISPEFPKLSAYNPLKSDWKGSYKIGDLSGLFGGKADFNPFSKLASQYDSPSFTGSGLLAQTMAKGMEGAEPQRNSSNPWQSKNLIKPASYFDESSKGIEPPKGLMGQDMITQNNVLPALQMALMGGQDNMPKGNEALDAATKPLNEAQRKGNATDKIQEARDKWKSKSLSKLANWQSLA